MTRVRIVSVSKYSKLISLRIQKRNRSSNREFDVLEILNANI